MQEKRKVEKQGVRVFLLLTVAITEKHDRQSLVFHPVHTYFILKTTYFD